MLSAHLLEYKNRQRKTNTTIEFSVKNTFRTVYLCFGYIHKVKFC